MLSYGVYAAIMFGSISAIVILGFVVFLMISVKRLVHWLDLLFDFKTVDNPSEDCSVVDVCDDRFLISNTIRSRLPFILTIGSCVLFAVLVFIEGCIFSTRHIYSKKECIPRTPECYLFTSEHSSFRPLYEYTCQAGSPVIPSNMSASYAVCYGFVLPDQSSTDVLNQLGVCTGLLD